MGAVLLVLNHHIKSCGVPPELVAKDCYTGYFEGCCGDQLVFQYDRKTKIGTLWHGDCNWGKPVQVIDGKVPLVLDQEERTWLMLVWLVATRKS